MPRTRTRLQCCVLLLLGALAVPTSKPWQKSRAGATPATAIPPAEKTVAATLPASAQTPEITDAFSSLASTSAPLHPEEIFEEIRACLDGKYGEEDDAETRLVFDDLLPILVQLDPDAAARFAESYKSLFFRNRVLNTVLTAWCASDPGQALDWVTRLPSQLERERLTLLAYKKIGQSDPWRALQLAETRPFFALPAIRNDLIGELYLRDPAGLLARLDAQSAAGHPQDENWAALAPLMASSNSPSEAADLVTAKITDADLRAKTCLSVVFQWARRDPIGATNWVSAFPPGDLRLHAEAELARGVAIAKTPQTAVFVR